MPPPICPGWHPPGSIAAVKRLLVPLLVVLVAGAVATACTATPQAASVNGTTISTSSFNSQLAALDSSQAGQCLLEAETGQAIQTQGTGSSGTYDMGFADSILQNSVSNTLAAQLAASKGLTVTTAALSTATNNFTALLTGEISRAVQQQATGAPTYCQSSTGTALTATAVLNALPASFRSQLIRNDAVDQQLLADGAHITNAQILAYYQANQPLFTNVCVSVIVASSQADATKYLAEINGGASFASVAKANSLDTTSAAAGGSLGCTYTASEVEQALGITQYTVGKPFGPIQDSSTGGYEVYEVASQTITPLSASVTVIRQELLQSTTNGNRVSKEIVAFAGRSNVYVNPQYGSWKAHAIVAPPSPPLSTLLAAASGASAKSLVPSGSTGTGSSSGTSTTTTTPGISNSTGESGSATSAPNTSGG
jgi:SurA N-terminal domain/PPIC-type PPIASE domain